MRHHVIGDQRVGFRSRMEGSAIERRDRRLQDIEQRSLAAAVLVRGQEGVVRRADQPLVMRILNRRAMQNGLNVSVRNFAAAVGYDSDRVDQT